MSEDSTLIKDEEITVIDADLNTRSLHELARNGNFDGNWFS